MWEAFEHAGFAGLDNLTAIIDVNRLGQTRETMLGWDLEGYAERARAFGWHAIDDRRPRRRRDRGRLRRGRADDRPADGGHRPHAEGQGRQGRRGPARPARQAARRPRGGDRGARRRARPDGGGRQARGRASRTASTTARRRAAELGARRGGRHPQGLRRVRSPRSGAIRGDVVALDGEVSNSTHSEDFREAHPDRYFEMFIAEQQLVAAAIGMQVGGRWVPFASTFAAFLSRAYDFVRMAAISRADLRLSGSHAGVSIGEDGPSQMALEDIASLRAIHGSTVLHPSDANQTAQLVAAMADLRGHLVPADAARQDARAHRAGRGRARSAAAASCAAPTPTTSRSWPAASPSTRPTAPPRRSRARASAPACIDCYSVKPIDAEALRAAARDCGAIVTVEDHWPEGGLGDAVLEALADAEDRPQVRQARGARDAGLRLPGGAAARGGHRRGGDRRRRPQRRRRPRLAERYATSSSSCPASSAGSSSAACTRAQERPAGLARLEDLLLGQPRAADGAVALERVLEGALFEVHGAQPTARAGSSCWSSSTPAKRSPCSRDAGEHLVGGERERRSGSPASSAASTSSQRSGVETVGRSLARSEYTQTVVLCSSFWLQSTSTLPAAQRLLHVRDDELGAAALEQLGERARERLGLVVGRRRVERDVDLHPLRARGLRERGQAEVVEDLAQLAARPRRTRRSSAGGPGSRSKASIVRRLDVGGQRERRVQLEVGEVGQPHERRQVVGEAEVDRRGRLWRL